MKQTKYRNKFYKQRKKRMGFRTDYHRLTNGKCQEVKYERNINKDKDR
jgi:hypothetical protein